VLNRRMLSHSDIHPDMVWGFQIIDLAMDLGYQAHTNFARDFQNYYRTSPSNARTGKAAVKPKRKTETGSIEP
jgi:AraC-like DNA-binding protein